LYKRFKVGSQSRFLGGPDIPETKICGWGEKEPKRGQLKKKGLFRQQSLKEKKTA